jgi:4-alpha-glucanotransferase
MLAIAALESQRNRCLVIGEDLGTVAAGFRERMADANVLSCRVFYFEKEQQRFRRPDEYPALASVSVTTHDLPTLRGFWNAADITAKARLGTFKAQAEEARARAMRDEEKRLVLQALASEGLLPGEISPTDADHTDWVPELAAAVHLFLARAPSMLLMVQLEDLANEMHQANLPGSVTEYPNWRRRLSRGLAALLADLGIEGQMTAITSERTR